MSNYTDKIMAKIQREQKLKEEKEANLNEPLAMATSDNADMDFELGSDVSEDEFSENFFNEDAQGDEVKIDLDEPEDESEDIDTLDELKEKEIKEKKKKKGRVGELEEQEIEEPEQTVEHTFIYSEEIPSDEMQSDATAEDKSFTSEYDAPVNDNIIDAVVKAETYEQQVSNEQAEHEAIMASSYVDEAVNDMEPVYNVEQFQDAEMVYEIEQTGSVEQVTDAEAVYSVEQRKDVEVKAETYEQQVSNEQTEPETVIASSYVEEAVNDMEPVHNIEHVTDAEQLQAVEDGVTDVIAYVAASETAEGFYAADEVNNDRLFAAAGIESGTVDVPITDATELEKLITEPESITAVRNDVIEHVAEADVNDTISASPSVDNARYSLDTSDAMNMHDATGHTVDAAAGVKSGTVDVPITDTTELEKLITEPESITGVRNDVIEHVVEADANDTISVSQSVDNARYSLDTSDVMNMHDATGHTVEEYEAVKAAMVIDNVVSAPEQVTDIGVAKMAESAQLQMAGAADNTQPSSVASDTQSQTATGTAALSHVIDDVVGESALQDAGMSTEAHTDMQMAQERTAQEVYIEQTGSNAGFDTRAVVADMVPDEQVKGVTEQYTSEMQNYINEFSPEIQKALTGSLDTNSIVTEDAKKQEKEHSYSEASSSMQENEAGNITSDKEVRTKAVVDDSVEQKETEVKLSEFREQALHKFSEMANDVSRQMQKAGNQAVHAVTNEIVTSDKNTQAGFDDIRKFTKPLAEAATIVGMAALASSYADKMMLLSKAGAHVDESIAAGKLSAEDLTLSKRELNKQLKTAGIAQDERKNIIAHRTDIHEMMGVRSEMRSMVATGQIKIDEDLSKVLQSSEFFDLRNNQMGQLLQLYYKNSSDDTIRNVFGKGNFTSKSSANFRKFLRKADKNEVSTNGRASIKMGQLAASRARYNRLLQGHIQANLKAHTKQMTMNVVSADNNVSSGLRTYGSAAKMSSVVGKGFSKIFIGTKKNGYKGLAVNSSRVVKKIMIGTKKNGYKGVATQIGRGVIRFGKYTDKSFYAITNHSIGHFISVSKTNIRKGVNSIKDGVKRSGDIAKKKALETAHKVKNKAASTAVGKQVVRANTARINTTNAVTAKYKAAQQAARKAAQAIAQTKAAKAAYATGNIVAKGTNLFIGTPLRFGAGAFRKVKLAVGKVFSAINAVKKFAIAAVGVFCAVYILLTCMVMGALSIFNTDSTAVMNILLPERDAFVPESIQRYLDKSNEIKDSAVQIGEGTPLTPTVTSGHTISKYGHPDTDGSWVQGYKIFYTDSQGNVIQDGANNVKDTLVLAYVQMDAEWDKEDDATDMMDKYFEWLNPSSNQATLINNSEETDVYFCPDGCDEVYYTCNDSASITDSTHSYMSQSDVKALQANGTNFYDDIASNDNGDYYVTECDGHAYEDEENSNIIHVAYHSSVRNGSISGCDNYHVNKYCTGHKAKICYGHRDINIYIQIKNMQDAFDEEHMVSEHSFLTFLNGGQWSEDDQDWCWCLYNADWYDLYGVDPSGGNGFTAGGSLSADEVNNILSNVGSASQVRQNIISSALSQVGVLPYYFGGKPTSGGVPIMTNHGQAGSPTSVADHVGRTTAGLDCFGFCQWAYWNATGSNILPEGSMCTTTSVFNSTTCGNLTRLSSASELKPGDLGFQAGHVGIFAGVSSDGKLMWIHCNGSANTVSYASYNGFTRYYRLNGLD